MTRYEDDPLAFLDRESAVANDALRIRPNEYFIGDATDARAVLGNDEGRYHEHSDFFHTRHGLFGPDAARLKIRREARVLLRTYLNAGGEQALVEFLEAHLPLRSEWPDCGNRLVYRYLSPVLLAPETPMKVRRLVDAIVEQAVLANARARQPRWRRMLLQFNTTLRLSRALEARQAAAREQPLDLLDVVARAVEPGRPLDELAEVYLSFVFAIAGSVGFVLGWSLYLLGANADRDVPTAWVVQEALRLWPVAWQLGRRPAQEHEIAGVKVGTTDEVVVCPYMVHRNSKYWSEPNTYQPARWADPDSWRNPAFIPFGHGRHRCIAADLSSRLVADILDIVLRSNTLSVSTHGAGPTIAAALSPPPFSLTLHPRLEPG